MDSLSQLAVGAVVGETVLGKDTGNRAMLWGAVVGTLPDLDILFYPLMDEVAQLGWHRGISHSLLLDCVLAPLLGMALYRLDGRRASRKGWTMLSNVSQILELDADAGTIKVEKTLEEGKQILTAKLPVVVSVLKGINEPRYPNFMGIRKASKKVIDVWTPAELGVELPAAASELVSYENPPARDVSTEIIDGETVQEKVTKLVDKLMEEKVL